MISLLCKKCGNAMEVVDVEILSNGWKRFYVYCFECDREYNFLKKTKN